MPAAISINPLSFLIRDAKNFRCWSIHSLDVATPIVARIIKNPIPKEKDKKVKNPSVNPPEDMA